MHISSRQYSSKDLFVTMQSNMQKGVHIPTLRDPEGMTLLHEVVLKDRGDLLLPFSDLGLIAEMYKLRVTGMGSRFYDMTPLALAEHQKRRCRDELEKFIKLERRLTKMCKYARRGLIPKMTEVYERNFRTVHYISEGDGSMPIYWAAVWGDQKVRFLQHTEKIHTHCHQRPMLSGGS